MNRQLEIKWNPGETSSSKISECHYLNHSCFEYSGHYKGVFLGGAEHLGK